jgi:hypothetical protein
MPKVFVLPVIRREDYDAFRRDIGPKFSETFDEWTKLFADEVVEARRQGKNVMLAQINYAEFARYCHANRKRPNPETILDFAISKKPVGEA